MIFHGYFHHIRGNNQFFAKMPIYFQSLMFKVEKYDISFLFHLRQTNWSSFILLLKSQYFRPDSACPLILLYKFVCVLYATDRDHPVYLLLQIFGKFGLENFIFAVTFRLIKLKQVSFSGF